MEIDSSTIAIILISSSIFQAIIIFFQSSLNRNYQGIRLFGISCCLFGLGFLFIILRHLTSLTQVVTILGNSLLLLAIILQYMGLIRFFNLKEKKWLSLSVLALYLLLMTYFSFISHSVSHRIFIIHLSMGLIYLLIASDLLKNKIIPLISWTRHLVGMFLFIGTLTLLRAFSALIVTPSNNVVYTNFLQMLSFTAVFIFNFIITFTFISMINTRINSEINASAERFKQIFDLSPGASLITTLADGTVVNFNLRFLQRTGFSREELANKKLMDLNIYADINERQKMIKLITENKSFKDQEMNFRYKDNSIHVCTVSAAMITLNDVPHIMSISYDITDQKNAETALKRSEEKYRFLTEFASDVIGVFNISKNRLTYISPSILQLRGLSPKEALTENMEDSMTPESLRVMRTAIRKNVETLVSNPEDSTNYLYEIQQICKNGDVVWVEVSTQCRYNSNGEMEIVSVSRNIEKRKHAEAEVLYLSYHDQLTGLYNRRYYEEELRRLNTQRNLPIALVMADNNGLKLINDAYGHLRGDTLLKKFAEILKAECRSDEIIFRTGGDEFVILLPKTNAEDAKSLIKRLQTTISNVKIDHTILSVSMGFSVKHNLYEDMNDVFKKAEDAMYRHKLVMSPLAKKETIDLIVESQNEKSSEKMLHSKEVSHFCEGIATEMGFESEAINQIKMVGLRHDIGEIAIEDKILNKPEELTVDEWSEIKRHPETGYHILRSVNELAEVAKYVLEHHECWDGSGYPKGLKGEEISLQGRIVAIADAYSSMTVEKPFRKALTPEEAMTEIKKCSGTLFDANIAKIFIDKILMKRDNCLVQSGLIPG
ncbi:diguanylate cyclase domain-containing protein [Acetobacterium sp.]|uniref:diguanylate cyclase domain-containing protein n=1 Tax=Acetobacterium sp. TaxID=1872094 RepID=UPI002F40D8FE